MANKAKAALTAPRPRIVLSANVVQRGVLLVVGDSLPITHGAGLCLLIQRDCEVVLSDGTIE